MFRRHPRAAHESDPDASGRGGRRGRKRKRALPPGLPSGSQPTLAVDDGSGDESSEPWYRQSGPLFEESFSDTPPTVAPQPPGALTATAAFEPPLPADPAAAAASVPMIRRAGQVTDPGPLGEEMLDAFGPQGGADDATDGPLDDAHEPAAELDEAAAEYDELAALDDLEHDEATELDDLEHDEATELDDLEHDDTADDEALEGDDETAFDDVSAEPTADSAAFEATEPPEDEPQQDASPWARPAAADDAVTDDDAGDRSAVVAEAPPSGVAQHEPPMVVPVRGYYIARTEDTLRSVAAQFLNAPERWSELRALNAAYPGIADLDPDELVPEGAALALPGDPLPWGRPDPVYLWTLAETFLFTAWGREPSPEEVVPFWRGLTRGALPEGEQSPLGIELPDSIEIAARGAADAGMAPTPPAAFEMPAAAEPEAQEAHDEAETQTIAPGDEDLATAAEPDEDIAETQLDDVDLAWPDLDLADDDLTDDALADDDLADNALTHDALTDDAADALVDDAADALVDDDLTDDELTDDELADDALTDDALVDDAAGGEARVEVDTEEFEELEESAALAAEDAPAPAQVGRVALVGEPTFEIESLDPAQPDEEREPDTAEAPAAGPTLEPPPTLEDWADERRAVLPPPPDPSMPYAGMPGVGTAGASPLPPEAEAPRVPHFLPSVTGTAPDRLTAAAQATPVGRSLAGTAVGDAMLLWQLARRRRQSQRPVGAADVIEQSLRQSASGELLELIEAAMRHLHAVTVGQQQPKPSVLAVRPGTYGFEVLLDRPIPTPPGWRSASGGFVLELPQGVTARDLSAIGQGPSLCPALVPVGTTFEGPLLLNLEQFGCLAVSGPSTPAVGLLGAIVSTLGSSPMAGHLRITAVGLESAAGMIGWEAVNFASYDSPELEALLANTNSPGEGVIELLVIGPGNDLLIQRAGQVANVPGSRLSLVGATSAVSARWPWRIHVDDTGTAVVHPISITMTAAQAAPPETLARLDGGQFGRPTAGGIDPTRLE